MQERSEYSIQVKGGMDEETFNRASPQQIKIIHTDETQTCFGLFSDQSALIGLLRYLHHQGFLLLEVKRER